MNCESTIFGRDFNLENNNFLSYFPKKNNENINITSNPKKTDKDALQNFIFEKDDFQSELTNDIKNLSKEDRIFFLNLLNCKVFSLSKRNIFEFNYLLAVKL